MQASRFLWREREETQHFSFTSLPSVSPKLEAGLTQLADPSPRTRPQLRLPAGELFENQIKNKKVCTHTHIHFVLIPY